MKNNIINNIKIDNNIIPLFSNPIYLKEIELEKRNKSNLNSFIRIRTSEFLEQKKTDTLFNLQRVDSHSVYKEKVSSTSPHLPLPLRDTGQKEKKATAPYYDSLHIRKVFLKGLSLYAKRIGQICQSNGHYNAVLTVHSSLSNGTSAPYSRQDLSLPTDLKTSSTPTPSLNVVAAVESSLKEQNNKDNVFKKSKSIINLYLKEISKFNMSRKGLFIHYYEFIGYNFNKQNNKFFSFIERNKNIYKLLAASFKSMYCLISKPVFISTPDKVIIQLFYFLFIPNILKLKKFYKHNYSSLHSHSRLSYAAQTTPSHKAQRAQPVPLTGEVRLDKKEGVLSRTGWKGSYLSADSPLSKVGAVGQVNLPILKAKLRKRKNLKRQYSKFRKIKLNVRIKLRNLSNVALTKVFSNRFRILCINLNKLFKKPVELDLIRLHYPYSDSNILVNLLGIMINKIKLRIIFRKLFLKAVIKNKFIFNSKKVNIIPAFLSGLSIRVGGRLLTHKLVPRKTVKSIRRGATADGKINFKDVATYTNKNKRGAFTISVKSGHNFYN